MGRSTGTKRSPSVRTRRQRKRGPLATFTSMGNAQRSGTEGEERVAFGRADKATPIHAAGTGFTRSGRPAPPSQALVIPEGATFVSPNQEAIAVLDFHDVVAHAVVDQSTPVAVT